MHRAVRSAGLLLASAAVVVGLGLLADVAAAERSPGPAGSVESVTGAR